MLLGVIMERRNFNFKQLWRNVSQGGMSRLKQQSLLNPGIRYKGDHTRVGRYIFRLPELEVYTRYMENTQYENLPGWSGNLVNQQHDSRENQPKKVFPILRIASDEFCGLLTSEDSRLRIRSDNNDLQESIDNFLNKLMFWPCVSSAFPYFYANGSMFIRFFTTADKSKILLEPYNTKSVWPEFDDNEELESALIRFIFDTGEVDQNDKPIWRWSQYKCGKFKDIEYDNPIFDWGTDNPPVFNITNTVNHNLGFVQGIWIKNGFNPEGDDGKSMIKDALDDLDDFNYLSSKESSAMYHSLYPTLLGFGVDKEDFGATISGFAGKGVVSGNSLITTERSPQEADLRFLEGSYSGLGLADPYALRMLQRLQHILKVPLQRDEVLVGYAQSAEAMKMLYRPMIEEVKRMRSFLEVGLCDLLMKLEAVSYKHNLDFKIPPGTIDKSDKEWGEMFTATEADRSQRVTSTVQATEGRLISRKTATKHLAGDFKIENVEDEIREIESESEKDMEQDILSFGAQSKIEADNAPKPAPAGGAKKPNTGKKK